jgi:hypothetical protein
MLGSGQLAPFRLCPMQGSTAQTEVHVAKVEVAAPFSAAWPVRTHTGEAGPPGLDALNHAYCRFGPYSSPCIQIHTIHTYTCNTRYVFGLTAVLASKQAWSPGRHRRGRTYRRACRRGPLQRARTSVHRRRGRASGRLGVAKVAPGLAGGKRRAAGDSTWQPGASLSPRLSLSPRPLPRS